MRGDMEIMDKDIVIIGGGVVGCGVARLMSAYETGVTVIERGHDVADGASKANSGIVHAGFDAVPGSAKARFNVQGARMYPALCEELCVPFGMPGALVLAFDGQGREIVQKLYKQGLQNGVESLALVDREELLYMEPNLNPEVLCGLSAATSGLVSPYELTYALADHGAVNGVEFLRNTEVRRIEPLVGGFRLHTSAGIIGARCVVNCAGTDAPKLHNQISSYSLEAVARKGEYYLLDRMQPLPFTRTIFQTPTRMGKGVLVSPTVHGNLLLGPTAEDVEDGLDVSTTAEALKQVIDKARLSWPKASLQQVITSFAGVRAHEKGDDFLVGAVQGVPGAYEAVGIESPGLTASPAIAEALRELIAGDMGLIPKKEWRPYPRVDKPFSAMTLDERIKAVERNRSHGNMVCRCEQVTEAEVRASVRRPAGARSIDGVKRRTRAGMGRCQGGFCSPRVLEILSEERGISPLQVTKGADGSVLLTGEIAMTGDTPDCLLHSLREHSLMSGGTGVPAPDKEGMEC
ncbi:MAG: NAD(P)/FAD-dependent oxidoreductase [Clostridia bacterium]|nr:NAD(P)/FAD-dependent oxidoreductase [Clostridia bacterium]